MTSPTPLDGAGKVLADVSDPLQNLPCGTAYIFGQEAAARAYAEFLACWSKELSTQVGALEQLATKLRPGAGIHHADDAVAGYPPVSAP
jgi:hypothetical protein